MKFNFRLIPLLVAADVFVFNRILTSFPDKHHSVNELNKLKSK